MFPPKTSEGFLLLNVSYEPLRVCDWRKAVLLLLKEKAVLIGEKILKLVYYVKVGFNKTKFSPTKRRIFERDRHTCQYCGSKKDLTLDHVVPKSKGGDNSWTNLVTACYICNNTKGNRLLEHTDLKLSRQPKEPTQLFNLQQTNDSLLYC